MTAPSVPCSDPDVQLMLRAKQGDHQAFAELVDSYRGPLVRRLTFLLRNGIDAEDVAQDVFVRVYLARHAYEPKGRFSAWLFRIAHNAACNFRRDAARRKEVALTIECVGTGTTHAEIQCRNPARTEAEECCKTEQASLLNDALSCLAGRQRKALILQHVHGRSYVEIGQALGTNPGAVRSLLARGRSRLREQIARWRRREEQEDRPVFDSCHEYA